MCPHMLGIGSGREQVRERLQPDSTVWNKEHLTLLNCTFQATLVVKKVRRKIA